MRSLRSLAIVLSLSCALTLAADEPIGSPTETPSWWTDLGIRDLTGAPLRPVSVWIVVVFLGQECPVSNVSIPALNKLAADYRLGSRYSIIGAYVDPTSTLETLRAHAAQYQIGFATADDRQQRLARLAGATYTPEAAVFSRTGQVVYLGRLDDRVAAAGEVRPGRATREELREVMRALGSGIPGPFVGHMGFGCALPQAVHP
jgi:hypothetical protein